ncbi:hypothetical protein CS542_06990 [Pedobacter sp. IW39]|nr:hypothetical protein CS542_06990 [Pedobacter sp. IW39]
MIAAAIAYNCRNLFQTYPGLLSSNVSPFAFKFRSITINRLPIIFKTRLKFGTVHAAFSANPAIEMFLEILADYPETISKLAISLHLWTGPSFFLRFNNHYNNLADFKLGIKWCIYQNHDWSAHLKLSEDHIYFI